MLIMGLEATKGLGVAAIAATSAGFCSSGLVRNSQGFFPVKVMLIFIGF